jgi:hypothetical protein
LVSGDGMHGQWQKIDSITTLQVIITQPHQTSAFSQAPHSQSISHIHKMAPRTSSQQIPSWPCCPQGYTPKLDAGILASLSAMPRLDARILASTRAMSKLDAWISAIPGGMQLDFVVNFTTTWMPSSYMLLLVEKSCSFCSHKKNSNHCFEFFLLNTKCIQQPDHMLL